MSKQTADEWRVNDGWAILVMLPAIPLNGWATMLIWRWFGSGILHLPALTFAQALAAYYLARWFQPAAPRDRSKKGTDIRDIVSAYGFPLVGVAFSWAFYMLIR